MESDASYQRKTKIIATLGPASAHQEKIEELLLAGADIFRLNFSHGTHEDHAQCIQSIRDLEHRYDYPITIMADLQGPKLRIGTFAVGSIVLEAGQSFQLDLDEQPGDEKRVCLPHKEILQALAPGARLLLDDGKIILRVESCTPSYAQTLVEVGGNLSDHKGVNLPSLNLPISAITDKDKVDLAFALEQGVDVIALSFVQHPQDIIDAKRLIKGRAKILAKIEKPRALEHIEDIIEEADAIMVARGDLGVEMDLEDVPCVKKRIVHLCRAAGKPVTIATQILDSMVHNPTPTRAEVSDLATAVYEAVDTVMLSAESASGKYPVEAVKVMTRIIDRVEKDEMYWDYVDIWRNIPDQTIVDAISIAVNQSSKALQAKVIVTFTLSGSTALRAARERPDAPILAITPSLSTARFLNMCWGILPDVTPNSIDFKHAAEKAVEYVRNHDLAQPGECIIVTAGLPEEIRDNTPIFISGSTNFIQMVEIKEHGQ